MVTISDFEDYVVQAGPAKGGRERGIKIPLLNFCIDYRVPRKTVEKLVAKAVKDKRVSTVRHKYRKGTVKVFWKSESRIEVV